MTDSEREELEQLSAEERARLLGHRDTFTLSKAHMDIICNRLFSDDDEGNLKLGRLIRDVVAFNIDGTTDLLDHGDQQDHAAMGARGLLYDDCRLYLDHWLLKAIHNAQNRRGKTKDAKDVQEQEQDPNTDTGHPTLGDVMDYARLDALGGVPEEQLQKISRNWYKNVTAKHWYDDKGDPIREWRTVFKAYCQQAFIKSTVDKL